MHPFIPYTILLIAGFFTGTMMPKDSLTHYRSRRNTAQSGEPAGKKQPQSNKKPIFVVQKHAASHLHYDFRLEIDGVLASWAVPKGPPRSTRVKRLAVQTEDHPMEYAAFQGTIPQGNYGAGTVTQWDSGTYENSRTKNGKLVPMKDCVQQGTIEIILHGKKLRGPFALIATHFKGKKSWLLIKMKKAGTKKSRPASHKKSKIDDPSHDITIGSHSVTITHPDKVMSSSPHLTKEDFIEYYRAIAPTMLKYLKNRPLVMQRFVDGIDEQGFYQKEVGDYFPDYIKRITLKKENGSVQYAMVNNPESLVYLANQGVVVFHPWLSTAPRTTHPDRIIFDLDPSTTDFSRVRTAALILKQLFDTLGLRSFVMTTGSRGLHVVIPIKPLYSFDVVHSFARTIAHHLVQEHPTLFTLELRKEKRGNKIFLDYLRNSYGATAVAPYSIRARPGAPVATPLDWKEVKRRTLTPDQWTIKTIFKRLKRKTDPWKLLHNQAQSLGKAQKKLNNILPEES